MKQDIKALMYLVNDYDEAINFFVNKLQFDLLEDSMRSETKRWVRVRPKGSTGTELLLAKPKNTAQEKLVGNQCGDRVFLLLHTDNLLRDYENLLSHHIKIVRPPSIESFGKVLLFEDLYGNLWDLIEPTINE